MLGTPELGPVQRVDGKPLEPGVPRYIVRPSSFPIDSFALSEAIKIVDFGEAFFDAEPPVTLRTPLAVRAPEVVFGDRIDHRVDPWGVGCLVSRILLAMRASVLSNYIQKLFELITGQPPFDVLMMTPGKLISQMEDNATDQIPERWRERARQLKKPSSPSKQSETGEDITDEIYTLQTWLEEVYFDEHKKSELSPEEIRKVGDLVKTMLQFEPSRRPAAQTMLKDPWFGTET